MITEDKRKKMTISDEMTSHPEPKFYPRIYDDSNDSNDIG